MWLIMQGTARKPVGLEPREHRQVRGVKVREMARARSAGLCRIRTEASDLLFWKATRRL